MARDRASDGTCILVPQPAFVALIMAGVSVEDVPLSYTGEIIAKCERDETRRAGPTPQSGTKIDAQISDIPARPSRRIILTTIYDG
jgi:hypothetical protein